MAEPLDPGELVEDLLSRLGLAVRLEQPGQLLGATPGVVDRMLAMEGQRLLSPLACLIEMAELCVGSSQMQADHCLINRRPACAGGAVEQIQGSLQGLLGALWSAQLEPDLALMGGKLLLREGKQAPLLLLWRNPDHRLSGACQGGLGGRSVAKIGIGSGLQ
jgi:hypothetical protein